MNWDEAFSKTDATAPQNKERFAADATAAGSARHDPENTAAPSPAAVGEERKTQEEQITQSAEEGHRPTEPTLAESQSATAPIISTVVTTPPTMTTGDPSAPPPPPPPPPSQPSSTVPQQKFTSYTPLGRPLDVTDALGYLDAVKVQFSNQPNVYNKFLDIMKEFKNEQIDTPGVIKRVSNLFNGHPSLIQGFNTFLPVGYRIECTVDAYDSGFITVTTPDGTRMQTTNNGRDKGPIVWGPVPEGPTVRPIEPLPQPGESMGSLHPEYQQPVSIPDPQAYAAADGQAIEPAVQYVQKIKQRCDPETYRQFLDILSQYHSNSKRDSIDEEEVSRQIARLFKDAPDLRSDFRIFMPDRSQSNLDDPALLGVPPNEKAGVSSVDSKGKRKLDSVTNTTASSNLPPKKRRKNVEKGREREVAPVRPPPAVSKVTKTKHRVGDDLTPSFGKHIPPPPSPPRRAPQVPPPPPLPTATTRMQPPPNDDSQFFDNVRRFLDNRDTYNEFLKIVNLFAQDIIDTPRLVKEAHNFLGDGELMKQFKDILGWSERKEKENAESDAKALMWSRPSVVGLVNRPTQADLNVKYGSYRKLPLSDINVTCSGRDEMCRSVLNDEWVSHPTWSSEDSGFISHRKNIYEEALHRSEEERHEYDFHIEAIVRTIAMLEPINSKIAAMSQDDRGGFKLKPNLGGTWKPISTRVVKKIYGREAGLQVIQAMQDMPTIVIPVVLQRLKQKEEEWKRAQREWNKVWREVDARNYTKSLDHQAIYFRAADKKAMTVKAFVNQIEAAREEQMAKRASLIDPLFARTRPRHQLEFVVDDVTVLQDVLKLTFSFLDRTQAQINFVERKRIEGFLRSFIPLFYMLDPVAFNSCFTVVQETFDSDISDEVGSWADDSEIASMASGGSSRRNQRKGNGGGGMLSAGGDLRKKLLKSEQAKSTGRKTRAQETASPAVSRLASPVIPDEEPRPDPSAQNRKVSRKNIFFTNTTFYVLLCLIEVLYSRLSLFKAIAAKLATAESSRSDAIARELQLPPAIDSPNLPAGPEHYYALLLESLERLFDNEIEQHAFEDQMRYMFGTKEGYKTFTIDKLIGVIIKQVQAVFADPKSQDLLEILKKERSLVSPTTQDQINSRRNAENVLGPDENLFRVDWLPESRTMTVQLIGKDDSSFDDSEVLTGRWQAYVESFVSSETTEGVSASKIQPAFLSRNLPPNVLDVQPNVISQDGLEIRICVRTYRSFFVSGTEDFLWKIPSREETKQAIKTLQAREKHRQKWLKDARKED